MNEKVEALLLEQVKALRSDMARVADDVRGLRSELAALRAAAASGEADAVAGVRRAWDEGLASGIAGDLDDVFDEVISGLPPARHTM